MTECNAATITIQLGEEHAALLRHACERDGWPSPEALAASAVRAELEAKSDEPITVERGFLSNDFHVSESRKAFEGVVPRHIAFSAGYELGQISRAASGINAIGKVLEAIKLQAEFGQEIANSGTTAGLMMAVTQLASSIQVGVGEIHRAFEWEPGKGGANEKP